MLSVGTGAAKPLILARLSASLPAFSARLAAVVRLASVLSVPFIADKYHSGYGWEVCSFGLLLSTR